MRRLNDLLFSSKFARRIFLLFVAAAVVPITVAALLSLDHVSKQLREQSSEQSRQSSKAVGMELYRRLSLAARELEQVAEQWRLEVAEQREPFPNGLNLSLHYLSAVAISDHSGKTLSLRGELEDIPALSVKQLEALASGKTVLHPYRVENHLAQILLARPVDTQSTTRGIVIGNISADLLWSVRSLLPESVELAVLAPSNGIIYNSRSANESIAATIKPLLAKSISGHFKWAGDGSAHLASYWSVFTDRLFSIPSLVIIVSQPEDDVLAPIVDFRRIYVPALLFSVLVVAFVGAGLIRKQLTPLVVLRDATRRIARGDFDRQVNIASDDEFAQLGDAFNAMGHKLKRQFTSLSTMAEIDRLILSSFDADYIIDIVLERTSELTPCTVVAVLEIENANANIGRISARLHKSAVETARMRVPVSPEDISNLSNSPSRLLIDNETELPSYLKSLRRNTDVTTFLLYPMFVKTQLAAVLILGYTKRYTGNALNEEQLSEFADHVAVALSNANWEERLYRQAHYDALTNLPNRALLKDRLEQAIARAQRNRSYVGVIFVDLDRFKLVNDSLGHDIGDQLLNNTAQLLVNTVRNVDTVVRFGGDEFVIIIPDIDRGSDMVSELGTIADKIIAATTGEFTIEDHSVHSGMSLGIALYPKDGKTPDELVKNADTAMYHAKEQGRDRYEFFAPELNEAAIRRLSLEQELHRALRNQEFVLHYQSKIDCLSGKLVGVEALLRWDHPQKGLVQPSEFIAIAEEAGLILKIGDWVLNSACHQMKAWIDVGLSDLRIAINVSPRQFREPDFPRRVAEILQSSRLPPQMLELEVTEGSVMENIDDAIEKLNKLNTMGIHLSVDDFGTGYSSLSYLIKLPIHSLKIDQSFVLNMVEDQSTQAIVASTIYLAHQLGLDVVAEGVETEDQRAMLQEWECDVLQGYLIGKPIPCDQFEELHDPNTGKAKSALPKVHGY